MVSSQLVYYDNENAMNSTLYNSLGSHGYFMGLNPVVVAYYYKRTSFGVGDIHTSRGLVTRMHACEGRHETDPI